MKNLVPADFYEYYFNTISNEINTVDKLLNELNEKKETCINLLRNYSEKIQELTSMDVDKFINDIYNNTIDKSKVNALEKYIPLIWAYIKSLQLYNNRTLKLNIIKTKYASNILTSSQILNVIKLLNGKKIETLLTTGNLKLGNKDGSLSIIKYRDKHEKRYINWGESNKLKKTLIKNNIPVKSPTNPNGEEWIVNYTDDIRYIVKWNKGNIKYSKQIVYFKFEPSSYSPNLDENFHYTKHNRISMDYLTEHITSIEQLCSISIGLLQKLQIVKHKFKRYTDNYHNLKT